MLDKGDKGITLAISGASGAQYGLRLLELLLSADFKVDLIVTDAAKIVLQLECDFPVITTSAHIIAELERRAFNTQKLTIPEMDDWFSAVASGSNNNHNMIVCPCSMGTVAALAHGNSDNLLERAADVCIKEQQKLILVVREMPFSVIHLKNMLKLAKSQVVIMPAAPGFYHKPVNIVDLIDFVVARILRHLDIDLDLTYKWGRREL